VEHLSFRFIVILSAAFIFHTSWAVADETLADEIKRPEVAKQIDDISRSVETLNQVTLLHPSSESFDARMKLIQDAQHFVFITVPFWYADKTGLGMMDYILAKTRGRPDFKYHVIQDWLSPFSSPGGFEITREFGDSIILWNSPLWQRNFSYHLFTGHVHDKFFIADGKKMIIGSTNINDEHLQGGETEKGWHDTDILVEGPAVEAGMKIYIKLWRLAHYLQSDSSFPPWTNDEIKALQSYFY
jgi:phosphatidylserine/phosphatidylglycerophosphate/cardiolipin synthase-like enzyme